jgi:hypothetical protein
MLATLAWTTTILHFINTTGKFRDIENTRILGQVPSQGGTSMYQFIVLEMVFLTHIIGGQKERQFTNNPRKERKKNIDQFNTDRRRRQLDIDYVGKRNGKDWNG